MKKYLGSMTVLLMTCCFMITVFPAQGSAEEKGEKLFKQNCAVCHPDGGNIINPQKTLNKKSLEKNNVKTADDIVKTMRNPGPGMTKFDGHLIPDAQAREIAEYILKTFK